MKKENVLSIPVMIFLIFGCTAPLTPTPLSVESQTPSPQLTFTALPTATETQQPATPTVTPEPSLRTKGPYFAYFREKNGVYEFVMMDADGVGRKVIELPLGIADAFLNKERDLDIKLVSPDGHWLAFYTGSAGNPYDPTQVITAFDLTLNLLDLTTGKTGVITHLLSKDYPHNFTEAEKQINNPDITAQSLQFAFQTGITQAHAWSPDGRYLAFASQIDGLSSDLYVYDVETKTVQRYSSGNQELQWINWSPDGKWILHSSVYSVGEGMTFDIYAAASDGSSVTYLSTDSLYTGVEEWLNSHTYFENFNENGLGDYGLQLVNIDTGKITKLWDGAFLDYQVDPSETWLVLFAFTSVIPPADEDPNFSPGLQLINLKTLKKVRPSDHPETFLTAEDGKVIPLNLEPIKNNGQKSISLSPDSKYWVVVTPREIEILSSDLTFLTKTSVPSRSTKAGNIMWRPDSSGLFLICGRDIYSMNILNGDVNLVEANLVDSFGLTYQWINSR